MRSRALVAAALACLASSCDYDAAYQTWCQKNGCQAVPAGDGGGIVYQCESCNASGDVCVVLGAVAACKKSCSGFPDVCGGGLDCKLAFAAQTGTLVPTCLPSGASTSTCGSPSDCVEGHTCASDFSLKVRCLEMCTPFKTDCASADQQCGWGINGYPADWGYCSPIPGD